LTSSIISGGVPLADGGLIGFAVGYALEKIAKFVVIGIGLIALLIAYLEYQKWISANWAVIENQTSTMMTQAYLVTQYMGHEIPIDELEMSMSMYVFFKEIVGKDILAYNILR